MADFSGPTKGARAAAELEAAVANLKRALKSERFTAREREAVIDALNRVLAGEYDGDIPLRFYESALAKL